MDRSPGYSLVQLEVVTLACYWTGGATPGSVELLGWVVKGAGMTGLPRRVMHNRSAPFGRLVEFGLEELCDLWTWFVEQWRSGSACGAVGSGKGLREGGGGCGCVPQAGADGINADAEDGKSRA